LNFLLLFHFKEEQLTSSKTPKLDSQSAKGIEVETKMVGVFLFFASRST